MRVLITGAHGQLGHDLMDAFSGQLPAGGDAALGCDLRGGHQQHEVFGFGPGELDVTDASAVISVMHDLKPDCVVHAAAYTAVDAAETDGDRVDQVNVQGTQHVLEAAEVQKARFITFSTDYVFDGGKADAYEEDDLVSPLNRYGLSKAKAESIVSERGLVIRSSWLAGVHGQPTVLKAVKRVGEGKSVKFVSDQVGSFTAC
ncbi:MAG: sugar nucleotide-binding protein, partial [Actinobacteria bacterium]|nr:sugar nucleotide-binding protein [Actinomycetota bacterium]